MDYVQGLADWGIDVRGCACRGEKGTEVRTRGEGLKGLSKND